MLGESKQTTDHDQIKHWAESRGGSPARAKDTGGSGDVGILRLNFPGGAEDSLEGISWEDFFKEFDDKKLAFLYQDKTSEGKVSRF